MKSRLIKILLQYILLPISVLLLFTYGVYKVLNPIKTVYNVSAITEKARCELRNISVSSFNVENAIVNDENGKLIFKDFSGNFRYFSPATIECERISNGPFIVTIYNDTIQSVGGLYKDEILVHKFKNSLEIVFTKLGNLVNDGKSLVIPFSGKVDCGEDVAGQVEGSMSPILREGTVTLGGYSNLSNTYFNAGTEQLYMGDRLIFENDSIPAIGFIQVSEEPAFKIAYRVEAEHAKILKPGPRDFNSGYVFRATIYDRLLHDKFFQSISLAGAILALIATVGSFIMDFIKFRNNENK